MLHRTTERQITFNCPFRLSPLLMPLAAGTYRVTTYEDLIPGLRFKAYRGSATMLHVPAVGTLENARQRIRVDPVELEAARQREEDAKPQ